MTLSLAVLGLLGLIGGLYAAIRAGRLARGPSAPLKWRRLRWMAFAVGLLLGAASLPLTYFMGYPVATPDGPGRIVGLPFFVAYFDSRGSDYVGTLSMLTAGANCLFWFLVPQLVLVGLWPRSAVPDSTVADRAA
jgi:hypothetical protein